MGFTLALSQATETQVTCTLARARTVEEKDSLPDADAGYRVLPSRQNPQSEIYRVTDHAGLGPGLG